MGRGPSGRSRHFYKRLHFDLVMGPKTWHERAEAAGFQVVHWEDLRASAAVTSHGLVDWCHQLHGKSMKISIFIEV